MQRRDFLATLASLWTGLKVCFGARAEALPAHLPGVLTPKTGSPEPLNTGAEAGSGRVLTLNWAGRDTAFLVKKAVLITRGEANLAEWHLSEVVGPKAAFEAFVEAHSDVTKCAGNRLEFGISDVDWKPTIAHACLSAFDYACKAEDMVAVGSMSLIGISTAPLGKNLIQGTIEVGPDYLKTTTTPDIVYDFRGRPHYRDGTPI
jgi:hypothetical protein